jgi:hypothetical protein
MGVTKQQVIAKAEKIGVTVTDHSHDHISLDCPDGYVLTTTNCHYSDYWQWDDDKKSALWNIALDDMSMGIEECDADGCEVCEEGK